MICVIFLFFVHMCNVYTYSSRWFAANVNIKGEIKGFLVLFNANINECLTFFNFNRIPITCIDRDQLRIVFWMMNNSFKNQQNNRHTLCCIKQKSHRVPQLYQERAHNYTQPYHNHIMIIRVPMSKSETV